MKANEKKELHAILLKLDDLAGELEEFAFENKDEIIGEAAENVYSAVDWLERRIGELDKEAPKLRRLQKDD